LLRHLNRGSRREDDIRVARVIPRSVYRSDEHCLATRRRAIRGDVSRASGREARRNGNRIGP